MKKNSSINKLSKSFSKPSFSNKCIQTAPPLASEKNDEIIQKKKKKLTKKRSSKRVLKKLSSKEFEEVEIATIGSRYPLEKLQKKDSFYKYFKHGSGDTDSKKDFVVLQNELIHCNKILKSSRFRNENVQPESSRSRAKYDHRSRYENVKRLIKLERHLDYIWNKLNEISKERSMDRRRKPELKTKGTQYSITEIEEPPKRNESKVTRNVTKTINMTRTDIEVLKLNELEKTVENCILDKIRNYKAGSETPESSRFSNSMCIDTPESRFSNNSRENRVTYYTPDCNFSFSSKETKMCFYSPEYANSKDNRISFSNPLSNFSSSSREARSGIYTPISTYTNDSKPTELSYKTKTSLSEREEMEEILQKVIEPILKTSTSRNIQIYDKIMENRNSDVDVCKTYGICHCNHSTSSKKSESIIADVNSKMSKQTALSKSSEKEKIEENKEKIEENKEMIEENKTEIGIQNSIHNLRKRSSKSVAATTYRTKSQVLKNSGIPRIKPHYKRTNELLKSFPQSNYTEFRSQMPVLSRKHWARLRKSRANTPVNNNRKVQSNSGENKSVKKNRDLNEPEPKPKVTRPMFKTYTKRNTTSPNQGVMWSFPKNVHHQKVIFRDFDEFQEKKLGGRKW